MKDRPIRSTKGQRDRLRECRIGVGIIVYNAGYGVVEEFEFYHDPLGVMRFVGNGQTVDFPLDVAYLMGEDEDGE